MPKLPSKTVAIIQARMGSTRLPGKVLSEINHQPMIAHVVGRTRQANLVDEVVVAVPDTPSDKPLIQFCQNSDIRIVLGSESDVLSRYVKAAEATEADRIVRITADCPLIDPKVIDETIAVLNRLPKIDYSSNFWPKRVFPRGLDTEVFTSQALKKIDNIAIAPQHREHVTLGIYQQPQRFKLGANFSIQDYSHLRWTVDTPADLRLIREIYGHFREREFGWEDIIEAYRDFPHWQTINQHVIQKAA